MKGTSEKQFSISQWTRITFLGWLLGVVFILLLSSILDALGIESMQFYLGLGMSIGVAFPQWLLLRKTTSIDTNWIWFSALGMGLPFIVLDLLPAGIIVHKIAWGIGLGALSAGLLQYALLKKISQNAILWIPGCLIGWTLSVALVFTIDYTMQLKPIISSNLVLALINLFLILAGGILLGLITGITLKKINPNGLSLQH